MFSLRASPVPRADAGDDRPFFGRRAIGAGVCRMNVSSCCCSIIARLLIGRSASVDAQSWARTPAILHVRPLPDAVATGNSTSLGRKKIRPELHAITLSKRKSEDEKPRVITNLNR
jgi:hypothetical protein